MAKRIREEVKDGYAAIPMYDVDSEEWKLFLQTTMDCNYTIGRLIEGLKVGYPQYTLTVYTTSHNEYPEGYEKHDICYQIMTLRNYRVCTDANIFVGMTARPTDGSCPFKMWSDEDKRKIETEWKPAQ
jgi:hypothetical protein